MKKIQTILNWVTADITYKNNSANIRSIQLIFMVNCFLNSTYPAFGPLCYYLLKER